MSDKSILIPVATGLLFGGSFVAGKYAVQELDPLAATLGRYLIALLFLGGLAAVRRKPLQWLPLREVPAMLLLGLTGIVGYHCFFFAALRHTAVANTAIINAFNPLITGLAAAVLLGEKLTRRNYFGVALAVIGVVFLLVKGEWSRLVALRVNTGDGLMLLAVLCWTVYVIVIRVKSQRFSSLSLTVYSAAAGVALLLVLTWGRGVVAELACLSARVGWSLLYMGAAASGVGYLLFNVSVRLLGPTRTASVVYSLVPVFAAVLGWIVFNERITLPMGISVALILSGLRLGLGASRLTQLR